MSRLLLNEEVRFPVDELFFSLTNPNGIIASGNSVFQRVSGYDWDELKGKPHKIIRHPDMPRAVFHLLWNTIQSGAPIGAYVKNLAKDGRYYWVFAIVTPVRDGFLSVRLKPTSPLLQKVTEVYADVRQREIAEDLDPDISLGLLQEHIAGLGYSSYVDFTSHALAEETTARDAQCGRSTDEIIRRFGQLAGAASDLLTDANSILDAYATNQHVALNFQVQAAQLGSAGLAIGQISKNYDFISGEIRQSLGRFGTSAREVADTIANGRLLTCIVKIQMEVLDQFRRETNSGEGHETALLQDQINAYRESAADGLASIRRSAGAFRNECADMTRLAAALEVTRVMGKVESARLPDIQQSLAQLLDELEILQRSISQGLKAIDQLNRDIETATAALTSHEQSARRSARR